jgi:uncharacterized membrane protein YsdA (DUF1294 family)
MEETAQKSNRPVILFAVPFLSGVGVSTIVGSLPAIIFAVYAVVSLITYVAYALDKSAARTGSWRTQEATLHMFGLFGGWPGALIAQQTLRHKSRKGSFRVGLWTTVVMNCGALVWLHTEGGKTVLAIVTGGI